MAFCVSKGETSNFHGLSEPVTFYFLVIGKNLVKIKKLSIYFSEILCFLTPPTCLCFKTQRPKIFLGSIILAGGISEQAPESSPYF
jgi:hypothetical protein